MQQLLVDDILRSTTCKKHDSGDYRNAKTKLYKIII